MSNPRPASPNPILAAIDMQASSRSVVDHALDLAATSHRPLVVLHVVHESADSGGFYRRHQQGTVLTPARDIAGNLLRDLVDGAVAARFGNACPVTVSTRVVEGVPAGRIAQMADRLQAERLVMVTHGRHGLARLWHGSVTAQVRRLTRCPVEVLDGSGATAATPIAGRTAPIQPAH